MTRIDDLVVAVAKLEHRLNDLIEAEHDVDRLSYLATYGNTIESKHIPIKGTIMQKPRYRVINGSIKYPWRNSHREAIDVAMRDFGGGGIEWLK